MSEHPIQGLMDTALKDIRQMMDVNTIIGEKIVAPDGTVIIPVSKVSLGFASGGSDIPNKAEREMFGGGSGAGGTIVPIAFLVVSGGEVKLLQISKASSPTEKAIELIPELFDKITALFGKNKKTPQQPSQAENATGPTDAGISKDSSAE